MTYTLTAHYTFSGSLTPESDIEGPALGVLMDAAGVSYSISWHTVVVTRGDYSYVANAETCNIPQRRWVALELLRILNGGKVVT